MWKLRTTTLNTQLLLLLLLATSIPAKKTARGLKDIVDEPVSGGIPNNATEDEGQYIVKFKKGSLEFLNRLKAAEANEEDGGERMLSHYLPAKNSRLRIKRYKAEKKNFLVKSSAEVILADTEEEAAEWETHEEVEYVERGKCLGDVRDYD